MGSSLSRFCPVTEDLVRDQVELLLHPRDPFQVGILLVANFEQKILDLREASRHGLDDSSHNSELG